MRLARSWRHAVSGNARRATVTLLVTVCLFALAVLMATQTFAATSTDRGPGSSDVRAGGVIDLVAAVLPDARAVMGPRRGPRFALPRGDRDRARELLEILGHDPGTGVDSAEILRGAEALDVRIDRPITPADVEELLAVHRKRAVRPLAAVGIDVGADPGHDDLRRAAARIDVPTGDGVVTPRQVERIIRTAEERPTAVFASTGGVPIHTPTRHLRLIGFHQASFAAARQLTTHDRVPMRTLPSRGRPTASRSAADISMTNGRPVLAPVTGTVVEVQHYALYGRYADARVRIVPDANPQMLVTALHVTGPTVRVGDRVQGGKDTIARSATKFPFVSQIDEFAGDHPHVHIEIRRR